MYVTLFSEKLMVSHVKWAVLRYFKAKLFILERERDKSLKCDNNANLCLGEQTWQIITFYYVSNMRYNTIDPTIDTAESLERENI